MARARVAVLISGRGSNMAALVYAAKQTDCPFEIVLVAANDPEAAGLSLADAEGIPIFARSHQGLKRAEFDALITAQVRQAGADYIALAGYMRLLSAEFVDEWRGRILNIHPSLLPKYKGLHTHQAALTAGDRFGGCSVHIVTAELDDGPVLGQTEVAVLPEDTPDTLADRVLIAEHQLYSRVLADFVTQDSRPAAVLENVRVRALALPASYEKLSHGMPVFGVEGGKMFAYFTRDHHGDGITALLVKISGIEEQAMLIENDPARYYRPAYFGDLWVGIRLDLGDTDWGHIEDWIRKSWMLAAPAKVRRTFDLADEF